MANTNIKTKQGFTIIEVVLVLAIAGLIFLMVFIAWPALQRSQRDTQRRNDYSMLSTAISNYATNNGGSLRNLTPASGSSSLDPSTYINEDGTDPDGFYYDLQAISFSNWNVDTLPGRNEDANTTEDWNGDTLQVGSQVFVITGADCTGSQNGNASPNANPSSRAFAIYGYIEGGTQTFCTDSQ